MKSARTLVVSLGFLLAVCGSAARADAGNAAPARHKLLKLFDLGPKQLSMSHDGKEVWATELYIHRVAVIDVEQLRIKKIIKLPKPEEPVEVLHRKHAREVWVSILNRRAVYVYDEDTKERIAVIKVGPEPKGLAFSPDEKLAFVTNWKGRSVSVVDVKTREVIKTVRVGKVPRGVAVTPDGKEAWVAGFVGRDIHILDVETLEVKHVIRGLMRDPRHLVFSPDGRKAYLACNRAGVVQVIDTQTRKVTKTIKTGSGGRSIILAHGGRYAYVANYYTRQVVVIDTQTEKVVERIPTMKQCIAVVATPDGRKLFVSNYNSWKVMAFEVPARYHGHGPRDFQQPKAPPPSEAPAAPRVDE